ncbi:MAG: hypothetical protein ABI680_19795 [Chthoniobacteraceae bacterium]
MWGDLPCSVVSLGGRRAGMKSLCVVLLCVLISSAAQGAPSDPVRNGNWWAKLEVFQRAAYVTGVFDGMIGEQLLMAEDFTSAAVANRQAAVVTQLFRGINSTEILRRLDRFYQDRRNQPIIVGEAIILVTMQSQAMPADAKKLFREAVADARKRGTKQWVP